MYMDIASRPCFRGNLLYASIVCSCLCAFVHAFMADGCTTIGACMDPVLLTSLMHVFLLMPGAKAATAANRSMLERLVVCILRDMLPSLILSFTSYMVVLLTASVAFDMHPQLFCHS